MPKELADIINYSDEESVNKNIEIIEKVIAKILDDKKNKKQEVITKYTPRGLGYSGVSDPFLEGLKGSK